VAAPLDRELWPASHKRCSVVSLFLPSETLGLVWGRSQGAISGAQTLPSRRKGEKEELAWNGSERPGSEPGAARWG